MTPSDLANLSTALSIVMVLLWVAMFLSWALVVAACVKYLFFQPKPKAFQVTVNASDLESVIRKQVSDEIIRRRLG